MPVTAEQLDAFHKFGNDQLSNGRADLTWDELFVLWESSQNPDDIDAAIRQGVADVDAGRFEPISEALTDLRSEFGIDE